jgi:hypothetical protein
MTDLKSVNTVKNDNDSDAFEAPSRDVLVRSIMTTEQVKDADSRKEQPVQVYVEKPGLGKTNGYYSLDSQVSPKASIKTDEQGRAMIISPVVGG